MRIQSVGPTQAFESSIILEIISLSVALIYFPKKTWVKTDHWPIKIRKRKLLLGWASTIILIVLGKSRSSLSLSLTFWASILIKFRNLLRNCGWKLCDPLNQYIHLSEVLSKGSISITSVNICLEIAKLTFIYQNLFSVCNFLNH